jgi:protein-tyrosine-phosphatase
MAEGLLRHDAGDCFDVFSAGTKPSQVRPEAIAVMRELDKTGSLDTERFPAAASASPQ